MFYSILNIQKNRKLTQNKWGNLQIAKQITFRTVK